MKKLSLALIVLLGLAAGFSAPNYIASVNVLDSAVNAGDSLTLYGFIDYEAGQGNPYEISALSLRYFKVGSSTSSAQVLSGISYLSHYSNSEKLLIDGVYTSTSSISGLSDGKYTVELLINNVVIAETFFNYDTTIKRDSKISITDLKEIAGSLSVQYKIENNNQTNNVTYTVDFYSPKMSGAGSSVFQDNLEVANMTSGAEAVAFTSPFIQGANILIMKVSSTDQAIQILPLSILKIVMSGQALSQDVSGKLTMTNCIAKENDQSVCEFSVLNDGAYPTTYSYELISSLTANVESTGLINPGQSVTGRVIVNAKLANIGTQNLTLKLKHSDSVLDSKQITVAVSARDKINKIDMRINGLNRYILQGDSLIVNFALNNTGDFDENVRIVYSVNGETKMYYGGLFTLKKGQTVSKTIDLSGQIADLNGNVAFEIIAENEEMQVIGSIASGIVISELEYAPVALWNKGVIRIEAGNHSDNYLTVRNNGNTEDTYIVIVANNFASLTKTVSLLPGESENIKVPVLSEVGEKGQYQISATACSSFSEACSSANYTLIVYELPTYGNAAVTALNTSLKLEAEQAAIFEILIENNNGDAREYEIIVLGFNGEVRVSPESKYILSGKSEKFLVYLLPNETKTQTIEYQVMESNVAIKSENLTLSYGSNFMTGFVTIGSASNVIVSILGLALLSALIVFGVKAFNQSKTELKYWK
ncbi:MAG: hypothetical protein PHN56_03715 [Candidatus Nanoarchaeia archaeon]|nr:hypothetical protein [Candidatus Nanoarchaeia archaeon]